MAPFGKVQDLTKKFDFEWQIEDFFSLGEKTSKFCYSPDFSFAGRSWYIGMYPNGELVDHAGYVSLYLFRRSPDTVINVTWNFSLKTSDGKKDCEKKASYVYKKGETEGYGYHKFEKRSTLLEKKSVLMPSDTLTIVCSVTDYSNCNEGADSIETAPCSYCKKILVANCISSHEKTCLDRPVTCRICKEAVALKNWPEHECETATIKEELVNDLTNILESEELSDFTIKVKDAEFRLHKSILASRNPYFSSMFKAEMKENTTGAVSIDDCEPDIFRSFIYFVYTGKLQALSDDNVCALYEVADKYQQDRLKEECLFFMKKKISVDNFCDFVVLALKHQEEELLKSATEFFCKKVKEIIKTVKWQAFLREYPTQANELNIKAFDYYVK